MELRRLTEHPHPSIIDCEHEPLAGNPVVVRVLDRRAVVNEMGGEMLTEPDPTLLSH
jgi:hypothetical protein